MTGANHLEEGLARLAQQYQEKPNMRAVLGALLSSVQELEDAVSEYLSASTLSAAAGAQLDVAGAKLGKARGGLGDAAYRLRLLAQLFLLRASGTAPDLVHLLSLLASPRSVSLAEYFPAGVHVEVGATTSEAEGAEFSALLRSAKAGGVRALLLWSAHSPETTLTLNSSTAGQRLNEGYLSAASD